MSAGPERLWSLGSRAEIEAEIDRALARMRTFHQTEPDEAMRYLSAITARLTEMAVHLHRAERHPDVDPNEYRQIRTMQVEKVLVACESLYRLASRELEARRQELELTR